MKIFEAEQATPIKLPICVGKAYLFQTVTHYWLGVVTSIEGPFAVLSNASWIADTGRLHDFVVKGSAANEVEPCGDGVLVNLEHCADIIPYAHELTTEQK